MIKTSVIVSYCSLDKRFIRPLMNQLLMFTDDIIIVHYDKLLNGDIEPSGLVDEIIDIDPTKISNIELKYTADNSSRYFHNLARWKATELAKYDHVFYLDADEIPEGNIMRSVLDSNLLSIYDGLDLACHWYFRSAKNQAIQTEQCGLLLNKRIITEARMFTEHERWAFRYASGIKYAPLVTGSTGPFMHHYSWVRTREEMITKVNSWGHKNDKDWLSLIEKEFSQDFTGVDFVHGYKFRTVEDKFQIGL